MLILSSADLGAYFGYELGASSKYDAKKSDRERASISGEYDTQQLSLLMKKFVREIVQCPNCHLPEITLSLDKKTSDITCRCSRCVTPPYSVSLLRPPSAAVHRRSDACAAAPTLA